MASILIKNIKQLIGINDHYLGLRKGKEMAQVETIEDAFVLTDNSSILAFGSMSQCPDRADTVIDAVSSLVMPTWCDSHTHLVFAASREDEFVNRLKGMTYSQIAENGGGILNSAKKLQAIDEDELYEMSAGRLEGIIKKGTGAVEIKSGYGLTLESEIKMLRVIRRLKENYPLPIKATFLGAHAYPAQYKNDHQSYLKILIEEMLPMISDEGLADYCDVFCENGFFSIGESTAILDAAQKLGLKPKIHANQLSISGAVQLGIALGAISVDHLEEIGQEEIHALKSSRTIPTLLPSCSYFLNIPYSPARMLIDAGLGVALATDYNPGTTPSGNIPFLISLACTQMRLLPEEAFNAVTINGACAMELQNQCGSISVGKLANLIITKPIPSLAYIPYSFGDDHIKHVILEGKIIT